MALALRTGAPADADLGQLHRLLDDGRPPAIQVRRYQRVDAVLAALRPRLAPDDAGLVEALFAHLYGDGEQAALDAFPRWRQQPAVPLA